MALFMRDENLTKVTTPKIGEKYRVKEAGYIIRTLVLIEGDWLSFKESPCKIKSELFERFPHKNY